MKVIKSPCTLQDLYEWIMANPAPSLLSSDRSLRLIANEIIEGSGMKTEWQNQDQQPGKAEVMSLYFLLEKSSRKRGKRASDDELGSTMKVCLKMFCLQPAGRACIVVDLNKLTFNLDDDVVVVDERNEQKNKPE